jgi:hypothetical protein
LLVSTAEGNVHILRAKQFVSTLELSKVGVQKLEQGEKLIQASNGVACTMTNDQKAKAFVISAEYFKQLTQLFDKQPVSVNESPS